MSSSDSFDQTASERSLAVFVCPLTRIIDEFEPEAQTSGSHAQEYIGPFISSQLTNKQLQEIREMYGVPNDLECRVPLSGESVRDTNDREVAFYPYLFRLGVRIPLHPFCC